MIVNADLAQEVRDSRRGDQYTQYQLEDNSVRDKYIVKSKFN